MRAVTVLYEDQRGARPGYGLHALVRACVFDDINGERRWLDGEALRDHRPMKGDANLLRTCREDVELIARDGRAVVAVFDGDRVRTLLKLPKSAMDADVITAIKVGATAPDLFEVVLLHRNMESVIRAAAECDPTLGAERVERALDKDLLERDSILLEVSRERAKPTRVCIRAQVPSFDGLVRLIAQKLAPQPEAMNDKKAAARIAGPKRPRRTRTRG